jgi:hypothetical protein
MQENMHEAMRNTTQVSPVSSGDEHHELRKQVSEDLIKKVNEVKDPKKGIKAMAMLMGIHEKTLKRLISCENRPGYQTVFKIYRVLYHSSSDTQLLKLVPNSVRDFLTKASPRGAVDTVHYSLDIESEMQRDPVFCEVYFLCAAGGTTKEYISFHYGRYGERLLEKMVEQEVLAIINKGTYILGTNQASMTVETIQKVGTHLTNRFYKAENSDELGENYISLHSQGLTEEAYNEWLKADKEAFEKKLKILSMPENLGPIKAFTFGVTDTLRESKNDTKH